MPRAYPSARAKFGSVPEDYSRAFRPPKLNVFAANGRQHRVSVLHGRHRLYLTESEAAPGDSLPFQFEQSVLLIDRPIGGDSIIAIRPNGCVMRAGK